MTRRGFIRAALASVVVAIMPRILLKKPNPPTRCVIKVEGVTWGTLRRGTNLRPALYKWKIDIEDCTSDAHVKARFNQVGVDKRSGLYRILREPCDFYIVGLHCYGKTTIPSWDHIRVFTGHGELVYEDERWEWITSAIELFERSITIGNSEADRHLVDSILARRALRNPVYGPFA